MGLARMRMSSAIVRVADDAEKPLPLWLGQVFGEGQFAKGPDDAGDILGIGCAALLTALDALGEGQLFKVHKNASFFGIRYCRYWFRLSRQWA